MSSYSYLINKDGNRFYPVTKSEIHEVEKNLNLKLPIELVNLYLEVGYGFIKGSEYNINRIMDPLSIRDFRLRLNDYEFYPDIELYDDLEVNKLIFFEGSESALMSIELTQNNKSPIYYGELKIADSLTSFLSKIQDNDEYYLNFF